MRNLFPKTFLDFTVMAVTFLALAAFLRHIDAHAAFANMPDPRVQTVAVLAIVVLWFAAFHLCRGLVRLADAFIFLTVWFFSDPERR